MGIANCLVLSPLARSMGGLHMSKLNSLSPLLFKFFPFPNILIIIIIIIMLVIIIASTYVILAMCQALFLF